MAKDGTNRGGRRANAGRKKKALAERVLDGTASKSSVLKPVEISSIPPEISDFAKENQFDGTKLCAEEIFTETYEWLAERNCEKFVSRQLLEQYAMSAARWIHTEKLLNVNGYISKHPTTGAPIASPWVSMSQSYLKQTNYLLQQIYNIYKDNCSEIFSGGENDMMEILLRKK